MRIKTLIKKSLKFMDLYVLYYNDLYYYCFSRDDKIYLSVSKKLDLLENAKENNYMKEYFDVLNENGNLQMKLPVEMSVMRKGYAISLLFYLL